MADIAKYITADICDSMRAAIAEAYGNEVFFVGWIDEDMLVHDVQVVARGNESAAPAIMKIAQEADVVIHNHPSAVLKPSAADLKIAGMLEKFSVAFFIVNNNVDDIYAVVEPYAKNDIQALQTDDIKKLLLPGGPVSRKLSGYEDRPQQIEMIDYVAEAFNDNKISTIEAGTGTGKTMAYLLPSIYWSVKNRQRIVISTNTINLQEQLVKKDIPFLQKVLPVKFEAVLVKGRSNYVCLRKVDDIEGEFDLYTEEEERDELKALIGWAKFTKDGSKADLAIMPKSTVWEKIAAESDTCTHNRCVHFRDCFVNRARRQASRAQILVVNHHLLFADLAIRHQTGSFQDAAVLPPYQKIIFDEAHHIENVATNYFGSQITRAGIIRILHRLHRKQKSVEKGFLHSLRFKVLQQRQDIPDDLVERIIDKIRLQLAPAVEQLVQQTDTIMDLLFSALQHHHTGAVDAEIKIRLLPHVIDALFHGEGLTVHFKDYIQTIRLFVADLHDLIALAKKCRGRSEDNWQSLIIELQAQAERLAAVGDVLHEIIFTWDEDHIRWIEARPGWRGKSIIRFQMSPLEIKNTMKNAVYEAFDTVVMTSATLTVESSFHFLAERIGLDSVQADRRTEVILPAPFDYERQVLLSIPMDMPDPRHSTFAQELGKSIFKALTISEGRAFILFTSYGLLNMIYRQLEESLRMIGISALKQGAENRHELLKRFKRDKTSVLFGTDSFWEGVDVEGDALESVIITKLPFKVPSEPIIEARYEAIEKNGGNAFMDYAVPLAVLKFKQGFGRLIRRKTDRGSVIIFDNRVIQKSYGKKFISSLPTCRTVVGNREEVFAELKAFFM
ncbi:DEAD/DEAH box helicase family protein [candidate division KSB1 bacterium]|nr:DEAD/DEAH box helicase family protein [candidate division KSB1 bacterium]